MALSCTGVNRIRQAGAPTNRPLQRADQNQSEGGEDVDELKPIVRWTFYLFVFSIPFEMPNLGLPFETAALTGGLFLLAAAWQSRVCFGRPPKALWWFGAYLAVYILITLMLGVQRRADAARAFILLVQAILICWCGCSLMRRDRVARGALLTLVVSCAMLALIQVSAVASTASEIGSHAERLSSFGQNPNKLGRTLGMGLIALIGLTFDMEKRVLRPGILAWPLLGIMLLAIVDTGSRGSLVAVAAGLFAFMFRSGSSVSRLRNAAIVVVAIGACFVFSYLSENMWTRIEATIDKGSLAKRETIFPEAWEMFVESPLFGWGPVNNMEVLGTRVGEPDHPRRDTHNIFLELLTATGLLGTIPFLGGLYLCFSAAWNARGGRQGATPLALIIAVSAANVGANLLYAKLYWFILAYVLAAGYQEGGKFRSSRAGCIQR